MTLDAPEDASVTAALEVETKSEKTKPRNTNHSDEKSDQDK